jgi:hypothetical protein
VRNIARIKLGYYPLPHAEGLRLRKLLAFEDGASAVDPCAGTGAALHQLTEGAEVAKQWRRVRRGTRRTVGCQ